jgi:hypothetical protein
MIIMTVELNKFTFTEKQWPNSQFTIGSEDSGNPLTSAERGRSKEKGVLKVRQGCGALAHPQSKSSGAWCVSTLKGGEEVELRSGAAQGAIVAEAVRQ